MRNSTSPSHRASARTSVASDDAVAKVAPVRAEVHAGDRDLLVAGAIACVDLVERSSASGRERPRAARRRDDAVAAALVAAGLHAQRERRAAGDAGLERAPHGPSPSPNRSRSSTGASARAISRAVVLVVIARRRARRSAARAARRAAAWRSSRSRRSCTSGLLRDDAPDRLTRALIGGRGDRAGVDDDEVGLVRRTRDARRAPAARLRSRASRPG